MQKVGQLSGKIGKTSKQSGTRFKNGPSPTSLMDRVLAAGSRTTICGLQKERKRRMPAKDLISEPHFPVDLFKRCIHATNTHSTFVSLQCAVYMPIRQ